MIMAAAILALLPPVLVILAVQRWCVPGLVGMEKEQRSEKCAPTEKGLVCQPSR